MTTSDLPTPAQLQAWDELWRLLLLEDEEILEDATSFRNDAEPIKSSSRISEQNRKNG
jgi:hypothetical protein